MSENSENGHDDVLKLKVTSSNRYFFAWLQPKTEGKKTLNSAINLIDYWKKRLVATIHLMSLIINHILGWKQWISETFKAFSHQEHDKYMIRIYLILSCKHVTLKLLISNLWHVA